MSCRVGGEKIFFVGAKEGEDVAKIFWDSKSAEGLFFSFACEQARTTKKEGSKRRKLLVFHLKGEGAGEEVGIAGRLESDGDGEEVEAIAEGRSIGRIGLGSAAPSDVVRGAPFGMTVVADVEAEVDPTDAAVGEPVANEVDEGVPFEDGTRSQLNEVVISREAPGRPITDEGIKRVDGAPGFRFPGIDNINVSLGADIGIE